MIIEEEILKVLKEENPAWNWWDSYKPRLDKVCLRDEDNTGYVYDKAGFRLLYVAVNHGCVCVQAVNEAGEPSDPLGAVALVDVRAVEEFARYCCACAVCEIVYNVNTWNQLGKAADDAMIAAILKPGEDIVDTPKAGC